MACVSAACASDEVPARPSLIRKASLHDATTCLVRRAAARESHRLPSRRPAPATFPRRGQGRPRRHALNGARHEKQRSASILVAVLLRNDAKQFARCQARLKPGHPLNGKMLKLAGERFGRAGKLLEDCPRACRAGYSATAAKEGPPLRTGRHRLFRPRLAGQLVHTHSANRFDIPYSRARGSRSGKRPNCPNFLGANSSGRSLLERDSFAVSARDSHILLLREFHDTRGANRDGPLGASFGIAGGTPPAHCAKQF